MMFVQGIARKANIFYIVLYSDIVYFKAVTAFCHSHFHSPRYAAELFLAISFFCKLFFRLVFSSSAVGIVVLIYLRA